MKTSEFISQFQAINVRLNWRRMSAQQWPVSTYRIYSTTKLRDLYMPWHQLNGAEVPCTMDGAMPRTVGQTADEMKGPEATRQEIILKYRAIIQAAPPPVKMTFPAYLLPDSKRLLLDGNHRAIALHLSEMAFEITLLSIEGPIDKDALPDLRVWQEGIL
jgi:hypothetical protein